MLFSTLFKGMGPVSNQNDMSSRRLHERREQDVCIVSIGDNQYPVKDWSMGGLCIETDSRTFSIGDEAPFKLKFRASNKVIDVDHFANVVRKTKNQVAFKFAPLSENLQERFESVLAEVTTEHAHA